jgi:hypothetical protein
MPTNLDIISDYLFLNYQGAILDNKTKINIEQDLKYNLNNILQSNYDESRLKFSLDIDFKSNLDITFIPKNLYSALVLHGILDPDEYIKAGLHKLLDNGYFDTYYDE